MFRDIWDTIVLFAVVFGSRGRGMSCLELCSGSCLCFVDVSLAIFLEARTPGLTGMHAKFVALGLPVWYYFFCVL